MATGQDETAKESRNLLRTFAPSRSLRIDSRRPVRSTRFQSYLLSMKPFTSNRGPAIESLEGRQLMAAQPIYTENFENGMHGWSEDRITDQRQAWGITAGFQHSGNHAAAT